MPSGGLQSTTVPVLPCLALDRGLSFVTVTGAIYILMAEKKLSLGWDATGGHARAADGRQEGAAALRGGRATVADGGRMLGYHGPLGHRPLHNELYAIYLDV